MNRRFVLSIPMILVAALCLIAWAARNRGDAQLPSLVIRANEELNEGRIDEAIKLLLPSIADAGDRLVALPGGHRVSATQVLGAAYWAKRDIENTLRYLQPVACRIPVDEDNAIPGVVLACRRILADQGKSQSMEPGALVNGSLASAFVAEDGAVYASARRIAQITGGVTRGSGDSLVFAVGRATVEISLSEAARRGSRSTAHRRPQVLGVLRQGEVMVPIRAFSGALGGGTRWDPEMRLAVARFPHQGGQGTCAD